MALKKIIPLICVLVIEIEAQFYNDANTQVGIQYARSGINEPRAQIGSMNTQVPSSGAIATICNLVPETGTCEPTNQCGFNGMSYNWCWTINGSADGYAYCNCAQDVNPNQGNYGNNGYNGNQNNANNQAIFHNDAGTQVGQQFGSPNFFNNHPETQVGNTNQGNNQAIFHNDANTQVGQQVGSPNYFNNNPRTQVGNTGYNNNPNPANNGNNQAQVVNTNQGYQENNGSNRNTGYNNNPNPANNGNNQAQVGNTNQGYQENNDNINSYNGNNGNNANIGNPKNGNPKNANNQAVFQNDANTQVGQQFAPPNNYPNGGSGNENIGGNGNNGGGRRCTQRNTEFYGTDLNIVLNGQNNKVRDPKKCEKSCRDTSGCRFWIHFSPSEPNSQLRNDCYLMSDKAGQAPNEHRTSGEIGCNQGNRNNGGSRKTPSTTSTRISTTTISTTIFGGSGNGNIGGNGNNGGGRRCTQRNTEFYGTDLDIILNGENNKVRDPKKCEKSCRNNSGCRFWTHVSLSEPNRQYRNACYLMSGDKSGQAPNEHRTSGEIDCNQGNGNNGGSGTQIVNPPRARSARSPQSALCPVCRPGFLKGFNDPLLTGVNEKGATFNRNAQLDSQTVGKGGTFFNGQSQIGSQIDIGLGGGGLGFINKGSQIQTQIGCGHLVHNPTDLQKCILQGRKKREAQFVKIGSGVGTQVGFDDSSFTNLNSPIDTSFGSAKSNFINKDSQVKLQQGVGSSAKLLVLLGRRKKREAQFTNIGSGIGTIVGFNGSSFLNHNSQIGQAHASAGASVIGSASQYGSQFGYGNNAQLLALLGRRKKREAEIFNIGSGVGKQVGLAGSSFSSYPHLLNSQIASQPSAIVNKQSQIGTQFSGRKKRKAQFTNIGSAVGTQFGHAGSLFNNLNSQIATQFGALGSNFNNQASQIGTQHGLGSIGQLPSQIGTQPSFPTAGSGNSIFNLGSQVGQQFGGRK